MEVLIISSGLPDKNYPLIGIFEFDQAKALAKAGIQVTYFALDLRSIRRRRKFGLQSGTTENVKWFKYAFPVGAVPRAIKYSVGLWVMKLLYHKVYQDSKPDIIHAHFTDLACIASKFCATEHIPFVITEHSSEMNKDDVDPSLLKYAKRAYKNADVVIAVGSKLARHIQAKTGVNCYVVPNIMAINDFYKVRHNAQTKGFGFVSCGGLIDGKRPLLLLEAFRGILDRYPDARLGFIGDGALESELENRIRQFHLENCVKMYGRLSREEIAKVYSDYDCFALPSVSETFGVSYIEAMAAGLPIIATRCGGPEDYICETVGILIPVDDRVALQNAMEEMINSVRQYDSEKIRAYVREHFSDYAITNELKKIYLDLLLRLRNT